MSIFKNLPPPYRKLLPRSVNGLAIAVAAALAGVLLIGISGWFITATAVTGLGILSLQSYNLFIPSAVIRLLALSKPPMKYYENLVNHQLTFRLAGKARVWLFRRIFSADKQTLAKFRNIDFTAKITTDINQIDTLLTGLLVPCTVNLVIFVIAIICFLLLLPAFGVLLMGIYMVCGFIIPFAALRKGLEVRDECRLHQQLESHLSDQIVGHKELLSFGLFTRYGVISRSLIHSVGQAGKRAVMQKGTFSFSQTLCLQAGLVIAIAILFMMNTRTEGPVMVLAMLVVIALAESILPLAGLCYDQADAFRAAQSIKELTTDREAVTYAPLSGPGVAGQIVLADLTFGYKKRLLFQNLSIDFPARTTTMIKGDNGSGKSTLMDLIFGFITPRSGTVFVNGISLSPGAVKSDDISYLEQDPALFNVNIFENISFAKPGSTYDEVAKAATAAGLGEHFNLLPEGLMHMVEEGGTNLSGGQKRMIGLARAIIKDTSIVMLDEPTEGMDKKAEQNFIELVNSWHRRKTVLIITHKNLPGLKTDRSYQLTDSGLIIE